MRRCIRAILSAVVVLLPLSLCLLGFGQESGGDTTALGQIGELPGVEGGFGVGCTPIRLQFSGTILFKSRGNGKRPLLDAELWAYEQGNDPRRVNTELASDGAFRATVTGWDEVYFSKTGSGRTKEKRSEARVLVRVSAGGCEDRWVRVDRNWRERTLVLKCSQR